MERNEDESPGLLASIAHLILGFFFWMGFD